MSSKAPCCALLCFLYLPDVASAGNSEMAAEHKPYLVNMVPLALSSEVNQDSEPFLALDSSQPERMVASAFTPNPFGQSSNTSPIYVSLDSGDSWSLNMIVPSRDPTRGTHDITVAIAAGTSPMLFAAILRYPGELQLSTLRTDDFTSPAPMTALVDARGDIDQPFVLASKRNDSICVYVALNDVKIDARQTAAIDISVDAGRSFRTIPLEKRIPWDHDGTVRIALAKDGTAYVAYESSRSIGDDAIIIGDIIVTRDSQGGLSPLAFTDLLDTDGLPGVAVVKNRPIDSADYQWMSSQRLGAGLAVAVAPHDSSSIYVAWEEQALHPAVHSIVVSSSHDAGRTWNVGIRVIPNAMNVALAVTEAGTAGLFYQQLVEGQNGQQFWASKLDQSRNDFATFSTTVFANVPADEPLSLFQPYMGDYTGLLAVGKEFRGVFSTANTPDLANFPSGVVFQRAHDFAKHLLLSPDNQPVAVSIDPFFFRLEADTGQGNQ
jgi:hypothetical protein